MSFHLWRQTLIKAVTRWKWIIGLFLVVRIVLSLIGIVALWNGQPPLPHWANELTTYRIQEFVAPTGSHWWNLLVNSWYRWDTGWYLKIAALGYSDDGSVAFPPLYPLLIRWLQSILGGNYLLAGLLIANLFCISTLILLYELGLQEFTNQRTARWAVIYLVIFPTGFYLFMAYSESLFLTLILAAWLLARRRNWLWAGLIAGLGTLARLQGWWLVAPLLWLYIAQGMEIRSGNLLLQASEMLSGLRDRTRRAVLLKSMYSFKWLPLLLPVLTYLGYDYWLRSVGLGSILRAFSLHWKSQLAFPWQVLAANFQIYRSGMDFYYLENLAFFLFVIAPLIYILLRFKIEHIIYSWGMLELMLARVSGYGPFISFPRYILSIFPIFFVLAIVGKRRWLNLVLSGIFVGAQIMLVWLYLNWFWVA